MSTFVSLFLISIAILPVSLEGWSVVPSFKDIFREPTKFFEEQSDKVKSTVNDYFREQQKKIDEVKDDMDNYVENIKESGRKVTDSWSFVPTEDVVSQIENPDVFLSVPAIITRNGYHCETHTVVCQGYILNLHRIPHSKNSESIPKKTVFLQHGLFASSADWIMNGADKGLAYFLADSGYDVWMANIRGNRYSKEHAWLKTNSKSYWNFSWHDVALNDVPAIIDYIQNLKGGDSKITYIGHSMGTTILFAMLSLKPEYNKKLEAGFALAPVVFLSDLKSPVKNLAPIASHLASMDMLQGSYEFIPKSSTIGSITNSCNEANMDTIICKNVAFYICGFNEKQFNKTLLPVFLAHLGTGTSWKTAVHFSQEIVNGGKFQQFDYGYFYNIQTYGITTPPEYDLSKVTLPIKLFWAKNDLLSSEKDVKMLYDKLPKKPDMYLIPDPEFNHLDYLWALNAPSLLNNEILISLNRTMRTI